MGVVATPVISVLKEVETEDSKFETSLGYEDPVLKSQNK